MCVRSSPAERPARNGVELARGLNCGGVGPGVTSRPLPEKKAGDLEVWGLRPHPGLLLRTPVAKLPGSQMRFSF